MNLLQAFKSKRNETQADLWREYLTILQHQSDDNSEDDAERLAELVDILRIDASLVELHCTIVSEHDRLVEESATVGNMESELADIVAEQEANVKNYKEEVEPAIKLFRERVKLFDEQRSKAEGELQNVKARRGEALAIEGQFPDLFGATSGNGKARPWWQPATSAIAAVQERLGISRIDADHQ